MEANSDALACAAGLEQTMYDECTRRGTTARSEQELALHFLQERTFLLTYMAHLCFGGGDLYDIEASIALVA